jgi:hypothetical protein
MHAAEMLSLAGFLLTDEEWQDEDLRRAVLSALAERASAAADHDSYESFEVVVDAA